MCTGVCYWANIGRIVYAASEERLAELTGMGNEKNMTMAMPCRKVLEGSQKNIDIVGPVEGWEDRLWKRAGHTGRHCGSRCQCRVRWYRMCTCKDACKYTMQCML